MVDFAESRHQVKLPCNENYEILGGKQRLKNSTRKCQYYKNLLAEYDNVFKERKKDNIVEKSPSYHKLGKIIKQLQC